MYLLKVWIAFWQFFLLCCFCFLWPSREHCSTQMSCSGKWSEKSCIDNPFGSQTTSLYSESRLNARFFQFTQRLQKTVSLWAKPVFFSIFAFILHFQQLDSFSLSLKQSYKGKKQLILSFERSHAMKNPVFRRWTFQKAMSNQILKIRVEALVLPSLGKVMPPHTCVYTERKRATKKLQSHNPNKVSFMFRLEKIWRFLRLNLWVWVEFKGLHFKAFWTHPWLELQNELSDSEKLSSMRLTGNSALVLSCTSLLTFPTASLKLDVKPQGDLHPSMSSLSRFYKHMEVKENILWSYCEYFTIKARSKMYQQWTAVLESNVGT